MAVAARAPGRWATANTVLGTIFPPTNKLLAGTETVEVVVILVTPPNEVMLSCDPEVSVPVRLVAVKEVRPETAAGKDNVTDPVLADTSISFAVPDIDVTAPAEVR